MKKIILILLTIVLALLTIIFGWIFYNRIGMDYNSEGNYFDKNSLVIYKEQAAMIYGIISFILLTLTLLITWKLKSNIKKLKKDTI